MNTYRRCAVPMCTSSTKNYPNKLYITVPNNPQRRKRWLQLARRDPKSTSAKSTIFFCEDHFDLRKDMENYIKYTTMGSVCKIRMKPDSLPSRFICQLDRIKRTAPPQPRSVVRKRQHMHLIQEIMSRESEMPSTSGITSNSEPKKEPIDLETEYTVPKEEPTDLDPLVSLVPKEVPTDLETLVSLENVDKCKCCLSEMELKTLWDQHEFEGDGEVYGEMLNECFGISWQPSAARESICEVCVVSLRQALQFKRAIIATQEILMGGVQAVKDHVKHEEDVDQSPTDVAYEDVQYLEEDCDDSPEVDVIKETIKEEINDLDEEIQWENLLHNPQKSNCLYCKEKFEVPLHSHMSEKHSEIVKNLTCEVCGEVFSWTSLLVAHKKKHNSRHKCVYCSKVFQNPHKLVSHMITHTHKNSSTIFI
ncbi:zinc finger protein 641 isoform X4 [Bicyclus anynana]|uniref:Zinc finger protein 641 isoform X4 n=1 Tax=Bicyclus anynana TaxID=110368 RepID=A0ABM3M3Q7_BICAN|nr:zinc finger protein 641 isoform X4 [Bicyclus anynana]